MDTESAKSSKETSISTEEASCAQDGTLDNQEGQAGFSTDEAALGTDEVTAELQQQVNELTARLRTVSAAYRKQQEEITATRERLTRQAASREQLRRGEVVGAVFEPLQNLRRSRQSMESAVAADHLKGIDMVISQFMTAFETLGLEEVPGCGSTFNPNLHEAISMVPVTDPALDNVVIEVFSAGYRIGSQLIAPARVIVGQSPTMTQGEE